MADFKDLNINFKLALKRFPSEGNLVYEYNPFYNYRLDLDMFLYKNKFWKKEDLAEELGLTINEDGTFKEIISNDDWYKIIPKTETPPILYLKGLLTDFVTDELLFDLNHPVTLTPSYSYDNSVDLIINDGKNLPRLINSRFSATERNLYVVNDREGNNDTNIYDRGIQFDIDTSLYKKIKNIPRLLLLDVNYGGNLPIGNYNFYFKYVDDDGNESDFFAESGLILIFIGSSPNSIYSGFRDQNAYKTITFLITNLDESYEKIKVYYTRATSDIYLNMTVNAYVINHPYTIKQSGTKLTITGYETTSEISITEINELLLKYQASETLAVCLNMLFMAHNYKIKLNYKELKDLALRFLPELDITRKYKPLDKNYSGSTTNTYYNPLFSYNYTGYWSDIYRFGIVFIYSDYSFSDVYNVRGCSNLSENIIYTDVKFREVEDDKKDNDDIYDRHYITFDLSNYLLSEEGWNNSEVTAELENVKGVVKFPNDIKLNEIAGIKFKTDKKVIEELKNLNIIGFFFVRLKRIPTILCQAYTIGIDKQSYLPFLPDSADSGRVEGFLDKDQNLTHNLNARLDHNEIKNEQIRKLGAICPEYDVNYPYFNSLFTGEEFVIEPYSNEYYAGNQEDYTLDNSSPLNIFYSSRIIGIEDNTKLVAISDNKFSARAGEAEEAFRYSYIGKELKQTKATNLTRGSYGPYLGMVGYEEMGKLVNIRIPHYNENEMLDYFKIRYEDPYPYYSISDRIDISAIDDELDYDNNEYKTNSIYRGDCFICNYTHRLNRNFQDPSAPANDEIVDQKCWKNNYEVEDDVVKIENFEKINLGDVNAIKMGRYVNLVIKSNINLNIRSLDDSIPDEIALFGHSRTFSPYTFNSVDGSYKIPEALCYNKGLEKTVSEKYYMGLPDVPFLMEDFTNRISYSNIKVHNSFENGHRVFKGTHYRDYSKEYGSIIKLEEWNGNLIVVCEHGVLLVAVNERAVAAEGALGFAYINTSNVLPENPLVISDTYGSQWRESIIKTPNYVYGVDTVARKIWRTDGKNMEYISDLRITEFLNNNISLTERELTPIIGIRNVKSHYNKFKNDVMFTFYDNLYGFEERVWNICFNEKLGKWITFYSWIPSYSENIYNSLFSFDRNTSKWIAKLGTSKANNSFSDGIVLSDNVIKSNVFSAELSLANRTLPTGDKVTNTITYTLERDNYGNYKNFKIEGNKLIFTGNYNDICSELYVKTKTGKDKIYPYSDNKNKTPNKDYKLDDKVYKDDRGRRINLLASNKDGYDERKNGDKIVLLLNIKAHITTNMDGVPLDLKDAYNGSTNTLSVDAGYYESVVAVIPEYNMLFLSTDFWRHGQAGIIDISDKIYPTYWYGKQHPFEFEFVVAEHPDKHKIFDNLLIISNKAEPESFHYEIVGECYDFAKDKKNMYIRQEATKELYQYNGSDITFDRDYKKLDNLPRRVDNPGLEVDLNYTKEYYDKSTILPLYYYRKDTINEVEDSYHSFEGKDYNGKNPNTKDFANMSGAEIVRYENLDEYRIWQHSKGINIDDKKEGNLRQGNMIYKEDIWDVQINPLEIIQKNETKNEWLGPYGTLVPLVPAELNLFKDTTPEFTKEITKENGETILGLPEDWTRNIISWKEYQTKHSLAKLKDKWIKIRIRYSGKDLSIISAIRTLYSISFA